MSFRSRSVRMHFMYLKLSWVLSRSKTLKFHFQVVNLVIVGHIYRSKQARTRPNVGLQLALHLRTCSPFLFYLHLHALPLFTRSNLLWHHITVINLLSLSHALIIIHIKGDDIIIVVVARLDLVFLRRKRQMNYCFAIKFLSQTSMKCGT